MQEKRSRFERGITLVEAIIVVAIAGLLLAIVVPKGLEFSGKSKSNALQEEYASVVSAFITLNASGSSVHAVKATIQDSAGNTIMKDYIIPVAPSTAFGTVTKSEIFRRNNSKKPIELTYTFNNIALSSELGYKGEYRHTGNLNAAPASIGTSGTGVVATSMSAQGAAGIAPLFSVNETKLLEDFIYSPNGLNFGEYRALMGDGATTNDDAENIKILAAIFGGPDTNTDVKYYPFEPTASTGIVTKQPIQLTVADAEAIKSSSSGATYTTLTDESKGTLYEVTSIMSRADFVTFVGQNTAIFGTADANALYDKLSEGFILGNPVFIPHREKDIIKSTVSDLKYGYYRP